MSPTGSRVRVELGERGYDVVIGPDYGALSAFVRGTRRVAVVTQTAVDQSCGDVMRGALEAAGSAQGALGPEAVFADLNTASPARKREVAEAVGVERFADVALLGPVPARGIATPASTRCLKTRGSTP